MYIQPFSAVSRGGVLPTPLLLLLSFISVVVVVDDDDYK
jgi:hypothetical protein